MNINTGEVFEIPEGDPMSQHLRELRCKPSATCKECNGSGMLDMIIYAYDGKVRPRICECCVLDSAAQEILYRRACYLSAMAFWRTEFFGEDTARPLPADMGLTDEQVKDIK